MYIYIYTYVYIYVYVYIYTKTHSCVRHDSFMCVTWRIHACDMIRSSAWQDSFMLATWLIHTCVMTHPYVWLDLSMRVTRRIHLCNMTDSFIQVIELVVSACGVALVSACGEALKTSLHTFLRAYCTGWRRRIGCLKLQVIFRKRATKYRALLHKIICKDKAFYDSTPPCTTCTATDVAVYPAPNMTTRILLRT